MPLTNTLAYGAWALVPLFAWADRRAGGNLSHPKSTAYGSVLGFCLAAAFVLHLPVLGIMAAGWVIYRSLPWKIGGTMTPRGAGQILGALLRHALPAFAALVAFLGGWGPLLLVYLLIVFAFAATVLSVAYAHAIDGLIARGKPEAPHLNETVELARGGLFGLALALALIFPPAVAS